MGGDDSQKLLALEGDHLLSGAQNLRLIAKSHSNVKALCSVFQELWVPVAGCETFGL